MKIQRKIGFTLVELIIVITILSVLSTIGFVSFSQYTKTSRDANRSVSLQNLQKGLVGFQIKTGRYPVPDNAIEITSSGSPYTTQGELGQSVGSLIQARISVDPKDGTLYQYSVDVSRKRMQLLGLFEANQVAGITPQIFADLTQRVPKGVGDETQPIFLNTDNSKISQVFDIVAFTGGKAIFKDQSLLATASGFVDLTNNGDVLASLKLEKKATAFIGKKVYVVTTTSEKSLQGRLKGYGMEIIEQTGLNLDQILELNPDYILCDSLYTGCTNALYNKLYDKGFKIISQGNDSTVAIYPIGTQLHTTSPAGSTIPYSQSHFISRGWSTSGNSGSDTRYRITSVPQNANIIAVDASSNTAEIVYLEETNKGRWIHFQAYTTINTTLFERALAYLSR